MNKWGVDKGHNAYPDTGASGWIQEDVGTRNIGNLVIGGLNNTQGHSAACVTPEGQRFNSVIGSLAKRCQIANSMDLTGYISIHMNASNGEGHGVEVYAISDAGRELAKPILDNIVALGFTNRGIKYDNLYVLRNTKSPAILVEVCFCDSEIDKQIYNEMLIANAIVKGLTGQNTASLPTPALIPKQQIPAAGWRKDIQELQHLLNSQGFRDENGNSLDEDGYLGVHTLAAASKCIIRRGARGEITRWVQKKLGIDADAYYGEAPYHEMWDAIISLQEKHDLTQDGIIGINTWKVILNM